MILHHDYDFKEVAAKREFYQTLLMTTLAGEHFADELISLTETMIEEIKAAQE